VRTFCKMAALAIVAAFVAMPAAAQPYPSKPITVVVPYLPGGATDVLARMLAGHMEKTLGQSLVVENKPGADARIGAKFVAGSPPDGHTILLGSGAMTTWEVFFKDPGVGPAQFTPIVHLTDGDLLLVTHTGAPFKTLAEAVAYAKANPAKLNWATPGAGDPTLMQGLLEDQAKIKLTEVRFKGAEQFTALTRGDVHFALATTGRVLPLVKEGRWRALANTGDKRDAELPDVPTFAEAGYTGFDSYWFGFFGPIGMPKDRVERVRGAAVAALRDAKIAESVKNFGWRAVGGSSEALAEKVRRHNEKWKKAAAVIGLKPE
jgi:tripartite-type tricarboxylate transporter receptor subunit TctC